MDKSFFHVDVREVGDYNFYYNMVAEVNKNVEQVIQDEVLNRQMTDRAMQYRNGRLAGGLHSKTGPSEFGVMGSRNQSTGQIEYLSADSMLGITAKVSRAIAEEVLQRALYYCPKDSGYLASTGRIEEQSDGSCRVYFDCPYAWYVHEFTWKNHKFPTCAKFLTLAIQEVETAHGYGWAK